MKFGILLDGLEPSQKNIQILDVINKLSSKYDIYLFTNKPHFLDVKYNVPIMHYQALWHFDGILIANSIDSATTLLNIPTYASKYLYVWEFQWMWIKNPKFYNLNEIYSTLSLISPSLHYTEILTKVWVKPEYTLPDFNIEQLLEHENE